jgi:adenylosuccinate lyase
MLNSMTRILSGLQVNECRIRENLAKYKDPMMSESVMISLVAKGLPRQEAHRLLQQLVFESLEKGRSFAEVLEQNPVVSKHLAKSDIQAALDPRSYIGASVKLADGAVEKSRSERRARGLPD